MSTKIINMNGILSLGSISNEKDLKDKGRININPPPEDCYCDCCGRHISEMPVVFRHYEYYFSSIGGFIHAIFS